MLGRLVLRQEDTLDASTSPPMEVPGEIVRHTPGGIRVPPGLSLASRCGKNTTGADHTKVSLWEVA